MMALFSSGGDTIVVPNRISSAGNIVHVSCSQINRLTTKDNGLVMFHQRIHSIITIGVVQNIQEFFRRNIYTIDDYTGSSVDVHLYKNDIEDDVGFPIPNVSVNNYIEVIGLARMNENKSFIVAFRVRMIKNPNEITKHFLNVIRESMLLEKRMNITTKTIKQPDEQKQIEFPDYDPNDLSQREQIVFEIIKKYGNGMFGISREDIHNHLNHMNPIDIDNSISFLLAELLIFNTIDNHTFKSYD
ncbi:replication protein A 32 kDa subunit-like [Dermatophagoides pteronyssinus]|uniref:replication protein A 32 kDa subunit-like n=1 Tax=Dermatophagoides pteronyssinus TaxID=6956 RepID=UPI003F66A2DC